MFLLHNKYKQDIMKREEIITKKRNGDFVLVAQLLELSPDHVRVIWRRPSSKRYEEVKSILTKIIRMRENYLIDKCN